VVAAPVFVNLGCRTNAAEIDEMASLLADARDVVVVNSCTVTVAADRDTRKAVHRARREHPRSAVILMGCYVDAHPGEGLGADLAVPNAWKAAPLNLAAAVEPPGTHRSRYVLKVQDGCDNRCTFCIVWQTRGRSISRVLPYLETRARAAAAAGWRRWSNGCWPPPRRPGFASAPSIPLTSTPTSAGCSSIPACVPISTCPCSPARMRC
jgi:threonylcarbamoyladenosine tRNA methylthiotransferase MtaB